MNPSHSHHLLPVLLLAAPFAAGCHARSPYQPPAPPSASTYTAHPTTHTDAAPNAQHAATAQHLVASNSIAAAWWQSFHSPVLNRMVEEALAHSPTLDEARARLRQAEENNRATRGAKLSPTVALSASEKEQQNDLHTMGLPNSIKNPDAFALTTVGLDVSYTFDLSGGTHHALVASRAQVDAQRFELAAAQLTLAGNVVLNAIDEARTREQIRTTESILALEDEKLAILEAQLAAGGITQSEVEQQHQLIAQSRAQLAPLALHLDEVRAQLSVYLGHEPADQPTEIIAIDSLQLPEQLAYTLPSTLAATRPDILAADALVRERGAEAGIAQANLYPRFTLSSSLSTERRSIGDLIDGLNIWSLAGSISQPVWNGGQLKAQKRAADAAYDKALAAYKQTVLDGLYQVAKSLAALEHDASQLQHLAEASSHARAQQAICRDRLALGGISRLQLINAELNTLTTEQNEIATASARFSDSAALMTALGGGTLSSPAH
ncbi:efflux transporter outer membrane subunit [Telmatobacter bradus]|uniref:efflux transporter outer membrane subunit n=1 Tax=Telmatobacter bradus TaxID=474953 RepID=UPI003B43C835